MYESRFDTDNRLQRQQSPPPVGRLTDEQARNDHGMPTSETAAGGPTYETGTTVVALSAEDGVIMAADRRMSLGGRFTASKSVRKVSQVHPTAVMAISGTVGPAQSLVQSLRAEASLYRTRHGEPMSMNALSRTASHLVRGLPVQPLLGGVDVPRTSARQTRSDDVDEGSHVYELDGSGSVIEDTYAAGGSGLQTAYGLLEGRMAEDLPVPEAREVAIDAVAAASERDTASGNGVTVATITEAGVDIEGPAEDGETGGEN